MRSTWHGRALLFVCVCQCAFAAHTTLGLRLFCRSGMRVWVRMYTPEEAGEEAEEEGKITYGSLLLLLHSYFTAGNVQTVALLPPASSSTVSDWCSIFLSFITRVSPMVLVAKFFSNPSVFNSLLCTIHPALFICHTHAHTHTQKNVNVRSGQAEL